MCIDTMALDCETYDSAFKSTCDIFSIQADALLGFLHDKQFEAAYYATEFLQEKDFDTCYYDTFVKRFKINPFLLNKVCLFHLSRTLDPKSFEAGIFPLGMIKDKLFSQIYQLVSDQITLEEWTSIIQDIGGSKRVSYSVRRGNKNFHGCYAMLIREEAYPSEDDNCHDYLALPETVEDLCSAVKEETGIDLDAIYKKASHPIIVKFFTHPDSDASAPILKSVITYLRRKCQGEAIGDRYWGFDAKNKVISPEQIVKVQFVDTSY